MDDVDRDALGRAMEIAMSDPDRARQLRAKLVDEPWEEVAQFAAYGCQRSALRLKPWEEPPMHAHAGIPKAEALLRRMLEAGLSEFEPDPLSALERVGK
jgi:hypothetical protein